jgi:MarR family transcriptional regulator for hemolysin
VKPVQAPIGLRLTRVARLASRAFDEVLAEVGGSLPVWLILLNLKTRQLANQRQLAMAVGVREATLTHHLNAMDEAGLITRRRDPVNRRIHVVELSETGEAAFLRLRAVAVAFDRRLRRGLSDEDLADLDALLGRIAANVAPQDDSPPWAGLLDGKS